MEKSERLSPMDAMMLFFETSTGSCNICAVCHTEGRIPFDDFVRDFRHRLHRLPSFRKIIVRVPFNLAHPTWESDPDFDLLEHLYHVELEPPGSEDQLRELTSEIHDIRFDFGRSPWAVYVVNGVEGDRSAVIIKFHHCMSDGIGARNIGSAIFDLEPKPLNTTPVMEVAEHPGPVPGPARRLVRAARDGFGYRRQSTVPKDGRSPSPAPDGTPRVDGKEVRAIVREFTRAPGVRFPFNARSSGHLHTGWTSFRLDEMRAIRTALGGTVNDVLLAIVAGAIRRVAAAEGIEVEGRSLRIHQAADVRTPDRRGEWGNRVAFIPALVPLGEPDVGQLMRRISAYTGRAKAAGVRESMHAFIRRFQETLPAPLLKLALRMRFADVFRRLAKALGLPPTVNMYVTNIRWPDITLHVAGRRVVGIKPFAPLLPGVGLTCTALSYGEELHIGITADRETMRDMDTLVGFLDLAYEELGSAAGIGRQHSA